jgi:hypothetical protein
MRVWEIGFGDDLDKTIPNKESYRSALALLVAREIHSIEITRLTVMLDYAF